MAVLLFIAFVGMLFFGLMTWVEIKSGDSRTGMRVMFAISSFLTVYSFVSIGV